MRRSSVDAPDVDIDEPSFGLYRWGKQAYPGVLTGKVSDFVGMVILPVVLVTLVGLCPPLAIRLGERRSRRIALGFSGCLLVAIKTSATSARVVEASLQHLTGLEHAIVVDPTDVIGLLGLLVAHRVLHRTRAIDLGRDGGRTWSAAANQFSYNASIHFDDMLWLEDDTVLVSAAHLEPVRRDPDTGQWSPTMAEVKRVPTRRGLLLCIGVRDPAGGHDPGAEVGRGTLRSASAQCVRSGPATAETNSTTALMMRSWS